MLQHAKLFFLLILGGLCASISCNVLNRDRSPSAGSAMNAQAVAPQNVDTAGLEIYNIRLASHQNELLHQLWQEVDEQSLSPQLRRELLTQGFRVGILGTMPSPALTQLLNISSDRKSEVSWGDFQEFSAADVIRETTVTRNVRNLLPDMRAIVKVFDDQNALPEFSLFWQENGMVTGQTYTESVGVFLVSAAVNGDGSAHIQIIPELEYGTLERRIRSVAGVFVHEESRPRRSFETLAISQRLLPGQWIILGTTSPDSPGVGRAFFTRKTSGLEQRLLVLRLIHATPAAVPTP